MGLDAIKKYLNTRINAEELLALSDEELNKYATTAETILKLLYDGFDELDDIQKAMIISEEMIFLFNCNIDLNIFYEYNGLTSFNIGGAVQGSVDYSNIGGFVSPMIKAMANSLGLIPMFEIGSKHKTAFAKV